MMYFSFLLWASISAAIQPGLSSANVLCFILIVGIVSFEQINQSISQSLAKGKSNSDAPITCIVINSNIYRRFQYRRNTDLLRCNMYHIHWITLSFAKTKV